MLNIFDAFIKRSKLRIGSSGPRNIQFFVISTIQDDKLTVSTRLVDKLTALGEYLIFRQKHKQAENPLNEIECDFSLCTSTNST